MCGCGQGRQQRGMRYGMKSEALQERKADYEIQELILGRWSPRALSGEEISDDELMPLFEAARWAPSSFNNQPWRFIYAKRNTPQWDKLFALIGEFNQAWTKNASALVVIVSKKTFDHNGQPMPTHSFDTGAAWENLALEASSRELVAHGMSGFDYEKARKELGVPDEYSVEAMIAIGKHGKKKELSEQMQQNEKPSWRKPLNELIMEGRFLA
jgi:nitroreductase